MKTGRFAIACAAAVLASVPSPVQAQMWFFPDYSVPTSSDVASGFFALTYGRGLNQNSGEADAFGGVMGRMYGSAGIMGGVGIVSNNGESEPTLGVSGAFDVTTSGPTRVSVQGGIGWMGPGNATFLRFPVGLAVRTSVDSGEAVITPWAMPRLNLIRLSGGGSSTTETDFGASGGVSFSFPNGFGVHTAIDVWTSDGESAWTFGVGGHVLTGAN